MCVLTRVISSLNSTYNYNRLRLTHNRSRATRRDYKLPKCYPLNKSRSEAFKKEICWINSRMSWRLSLYTYIIRLRRACGASVRHALSRHNYMYNVCTVFCICIYHYYCHYEYGGNGGGGSIDQRRHRKSSSETAFSYADVYY